MLNGILTLGWEDVGKGLLMAVLGAVLGVLYTMLNDNGTIVWATVEHAAELAGVTYLVKNFFENNNGSFLGVVG